MLWIQTVRCHACHLFCFPSLLMTQEGLGELGSLYTMCTSCFSVRHNRGCTLLCVLVLTFWLARTEGVLIHISYFV